MKQNYGLRYIGLAIINGLFVVGSLGCLPGSTSNVKSTPEVNKEAVSTSAAQTQNPKEAVVVSAGSVQLASSIPYAENANVNGNVKDKCQLDTKLASFIKTNETSVVLTDEPLSEKSSGKILLLEITNVQATGGGAWSGPKSVSVAGKLFDNGIQVGDFTGSRYTTGGAFGGFKGTCALVGRCVKSLGKDIGQWLKNPAPGSSLGNG